MTPTIWETIADTPWWVSLFVIYLIGISYYATKPRLVPTKAFIRLPLIFVALSLFALIYQGQITFYNVDIWLACSVLGLALGWLHFRIINVKAIKNSSQLYVPGSWLLSLFILLLVLMKFIMHVEFNTNMVLQFFLGKNPRVLIGLYGLCTGILFGRLIYSLRCLKVGPYKVSN